MEIKIPELSLVVLIGVSGSGKSSFARKHFKRTEILSSDECRALISDDENKQSATDDAFDVAVATYTYYNPEQVVHVQKWYSEYEEWCNATKKEIAMIQEYEFKIPE